MFLYDVLPDVFIYYIHFQVNERSIPIWLGALYLTLITSDFIYSFLDYFSHNAGFFSGLLSLTGIMSMYSFARMTGIREVMAYLMASIECE